MTPTAAGILFFGDVGGKLYVVDAASSEKLWGQQLYGGIGGGVITYMANGAQKGGRLYAPCLANKDRDREDRGAGLGPGASGASEGRAMRFPCHPPLPLI